MFQPFLRQRGGLLGSHELGDAQRRCHLRRQRAEQPPVVAGIALSAPSWPKTQPADQFMLADQRHY
jgi:hypothetical protein